MNKILTDATIWQTLEDIYAKWNKQDTKGQLS